MHKTVMWPFEDSPQPLLFYLDSNGPEGSAENNNERLLIIKMTVMIMSSITIIYTVFEQIK